MKTSLRIVAVAVLALSFAGFALADTTQKSDRKGDTKGEPMQSSFDFKSAKVEHAGTGHGAGDVMIHTVTAWKRAGYKSVVLDLKTGEDEFYATVQKKPRQKAAIYNYYSGEKIGTAKYTKISGRSFSFTFSMEEFGLPGRYAWRWRTIAKGSTDFEQKSYDKVPNKGIIWHDLSHG